MYGATKDDTKLKPYLYGWPQLFQVYNLKILLFRVSLLVYFKILLIA
jgi:hypothetical protein